MSKDITPYKFVSG